LTGQFFFTLLNPAVAAILSATFLILWRQRRDQAYLAILAVAFCCSGLGFVVNDFMRPFEAPVWRIASNLFFMTAVVCACIGALLRVKARIPVTLYAIICALCAVSFCWFLFVSPSTEARVYIVNLAIFVLAGTTSWTLARSRPQGGMDKLFIGLILALMLLGLLRPLAIAFRQLDTNSAGSLRESTYWATVQAATPILAMTIGLAFLIALAIKLFDELSFEANRDFLTGLLNRRGFDKGVQRALAHQATEGRPPAVVIVDIDSFKQVNDSYGHAVGDDVIATVARTLVRHGGADLVARTGGEEFTLFYGSSDRSDLLALSDAISSALGSTEFAGMPSDKRVTVSMGLYARHGSETISEMMASADSALYTAKRSGKDRAVLAPAPTPLRADPPQHDRRTGSRSRAS
jgi:diguanylate cyclase (GGDEF)-like protein